MIQFIEMLSFSFSQHVQYFNTEMITWNIDKSILKNLILLSLFKVNCKMYDCVSFLIEMSIRKMTVDILHTLTSTTSLSCTKGLAPAILVLSIHLSRMFFIGNR